MYLPLGFAPKSEKNPFFSGSGRATSSLDFSMTTGGGRGAATVTVGSGLGAGVSGGLFVMEGCFGTDGGEGFETGLAFGTGFGPVFLADDGCAGRFGGGAFFFEVGIGGFLVGEAFWELGLELF